MLICLYVCMFIYMDYVYYVCMYYVYMYMNELTLSMRNPK